MDSKKFFVCKHCGNIVGMIKESGVPLKCCGENMVELVPNTTDAAQEKHVPVATVEGNKISVKVGSVTHPMLEEHSIEWIGLQSEQGFQRKVLAPGKAPEAEFLITDGDKALEVYEYCNLHGLWKASL